MVAIGKQEKSRSSVFLKGKKKLGEKKLSPSVFSSLCLRLLGEVSIEVANKIDSSR